MSFYIEIDGDPSEVKHSGQTLSNVGKDMTNPLKQAVNQIKHLEAGHPWGTDEAGRAFHDSYTKQNANVDVRKGARSMGPALESIGHRVMKSVDLFTSTDAEGEGNIRKVDGDMNEVLNIPYV